MTEALYIGGIGATNTELSRYMLSSDEILEDAIDRLLGRYKVHYQDGTTEYKSYIDKRADSHITGRVYNNYCLGWYRGKLQEILNKNLFLSNFNRVEMYREARCMIQNFLTELFYNSMTFELDIEKYEELKNMYSNYLSQAIRHPLNEGDKKFLKETTSESTQKLQQTSTEQQKKEGGFFGLNL